MRKLHFGTEGEMSWILEDNSVGQPKTVVSDPRSSHEAMAHQPRSPKIVGQSWVPPRLDT